MAADNLTEVIRIRATFSLLLASVFLSACGGGGQARPDLPESVSPGWKLSSLAQTPAPAELPQSATPPVCWKAEYAGQGSAQMFVCRYGVEAAAFDAVQRVPAEAQAVKFQVGAWFVLVKWNGAAKTDLTALIRTVQKSLAKK
jgi:hypothetical protein